MTVVHDLRSASVDTDHQLLPLLMMLVARPHLPAADVVAAAAAAHLAADELSDRLRLATTLQMSHMATRENSWLCQ